jgi:hypothetical protein
MPKIFQPFELELLPEGNGLVQQGNLIFFLPNI